MAAELVMLGLQRVHPCGARRHGKHSVGTKRCLVVAGRVSCQGVCAHIAGHELEASGPTDQHNQASAKLWKRREVSGVSAVTMRVPAQHYFAGCFGKL